MHVPAAISYVLSTPTDQMWPHVYYELLHVARGTFRRQASPSIRRLPQHVPPLVADWSTALADSLSVVINKLTTWFQSISGGG